MGWVGMEYSWRAKNELLEKEETSELRRCRILFGTRSFFVVVVCLLLFCFFFCFVFVSSFSFIVKRKKHKKL